ncbi:MAG: restriction endonuclease [Oscillospiraceae bacterium]|nr:restriction endonuclease [Oscillospiraceae bacterium]
MARRTFGWVQNPSDLKALKRIVGSLVSGSDDNEWLLGKLDTIYRYQRMTESDYLRLRAVLANGEVRYKYADLKGKGSSGNRRNALCSGIVQAAVNGQRKLSLTDRAGNTAQMKKPYTDDWTADGFIRWAISTGLLKYDQTTDTCEVTDIGRRLANAATDAEEMEILGEALLRYPPVYRILSLLSDGEIHTKFELGNKLGFKGERGFTSIPQDDFVYDFETAQAGRKHGVKANLEGDSDKYARGIARWCCQMGWVITGRKAVSVDAYGRHFDTVLNGWKITREGNRAIARSKGYSRHPSIPKIVTYEMLATKSSNADYLRSRRANIIKLLDREKSLEQIVRRMRDLGFQDDAAFYTDDIRNFTNIGIRVEQNGDRYRIIDNIVGLNIPDTYAVRGDHVIAIKGEVINELRTLDHAYLELIDLAFSDANTAAQRNADAREFEIKTAQLFTRELGFGGVWLGGADKPDVIIFDGDKGTIIDNKSYRNGFSIPGAARDEMMRYIEQNQRRQQGVPANEWWRSFPENVVDFSFLFITSYLTGGFRDSLQYIHNLRGINGGGIAVKNLLLIAEQIKSGVKTRQDFLTAMDNNEIVA